MSKLLEYFNTMDKSAVTRAAHQNAPVDSMSAFGLTADEQQAVLSGDRQSLAEAVGLAAVDFPAMHTPNTVFLPSQSAPGDLKTLHIPLSLFL